MKMILKIRSKLFLAVLLCLSGGISASAQSALTLKEAVDYALKNKADAIKSALDVENADYMIEEARANILPQINGQAGLTYNPKLQQMALDLGEPSKINGQQRAGNEWRRRGIFFYGGVRSV